jgi:hypothetical protein
MIIYMNTKPIRLKTESRHYQCYASTNWEQDSLTLSVIFTYSDDDSDQNTWTLSDRLSQEFNIDQGDYRIVLGEMDVLLDKSRRLKSMEIRTNPATWDSGTLLPVSGGQDDMSIDFMVDYDENRIASHDLPIRIIYDQSNRALSFYFADFASSRWVAVADGFVVGTTADHYLSEFRLFDIIRSKDGVQIGHPSQDILKSARD